MTLLEITAQLSELDRESTIYAAKPWSPQSVAIVAAEPQGGGVPIATAQQSMAYFLEIFIAQDFLEDWPATSKKSVQERCQRLIDYAINDA